MGAFPGRPYRPIKQTQTGAAPSIRAAASIAPGSVKGVTRSQIARQPRCQKLIRQNPQMLGIVTEFHHVEISVGAAHQVSLRPAPHPPHVLDSDYSHIQWLGSGSAAQSAPSYPEFLFLDVTDEHR